MSEVEFKMPDQEISLDEPQVMLWRVLIEPYEVPDKIGLIELPQDVKDNAGVLMNIGKIVQLGNLAYKSQTKSGMNLSDCAVASALKAGDWVMYGKYAGQKIFMRDGRKFVVLNDDEIIARVAEPGQYQSYI